MMAAVSKSKFKVGDRVRCPMGIGGATVSEVRADGRYTVNWDDGERGDIWWDDEDFEHDPVIAPAITAPSAPAATSATRTVTRREIVPGSYGYLNWSGSKDREVTLFIDSEPYTAIDLREAASLFNELASVLDENAVGREGEAV